MNLSNEEVLELAKKCGAVHVVTWNQYVFDEKELLTFATALEAKILAGLDVEPAKVRYDKHDLIEHLRFFLSFSLHGKDWLDLEPFIDDISAALIAKRLKGRDEQREIDAKIADEWGESYIVNAIRNQQPSEGEKE